MNGGKCGDLCFRNEEFEEVYQKFSRYDGILPIKFIDETPKEAA